MYAWLVAFYVYANRSNSVVFGWFVFLLFFSLFYYKILAFFSPHLIECGLVSGPLPLVPQSRHVSPYIRSRNGIISINKLLLNSWAERRRPWNVTHKRSINQGNFETVNYFRKMCKLILKMIVFWRWAWKMGFLLALCCVCVIICFWVWLIVSFAWSCLSWLDSVWRFMHF